MRTNDVQDELAEGFEPTALPPVAPDGSLELPPMREAPRHPPRLCEQGPCANYHTFTIQLDAAKPLPEKQPDGSMVAAEVRDHVEVHHYCYPSVGIESKLGSLPVIQCNRWHPKTQAEIASEEVRHEEWHHSPGGQRYLAELEQYKADQERIAREEAEAISDASADLAQMPVGQCELDLGVSNGEVSTVAGIDVTTTIRFPAVFTWDATLELVRDRALERANVPADQYGQYAIVAVRPNAFSTSGPDRYDLIRPAADNFPGKVDLSTTISQAGLSSGDRLLFTKRPHKETP